jgi:hypothetical protein
MVCIAQVSAWAEVFLNTEATESADTETLAQPDPAHFARQRLGGCDGGRSGDDSTGGDRQNDPEDYIGEQARAAANQEHQPEYPDDGWVHVEIVGEAGADAGDLFVGAGAHESFMGTGGGRESWRAGFGLLGAAVVTELGTDRDVSAAACAGHWRTLQKVEFRAIPTIEYAQKGEKVSSTLGGERGDQYSRSCFTVAVIWLVWGRMTSSSLGW